MDDLRLLSARKALMRVWKKTYNCNGAIMEITSKSGDVVHVIQLQGDHRGVVRRHLIDEGICRSSIIVVHGFQ